MTPQKTIVAEASCRVDLAGGTLDLWPLYLFHPGAVTVNFALSIGTSCRIEPRRGREIVLRSKDTRRDDRFASMEALHEAKGYKHPLAALLCKHFFERGDKVQGFTLETHSESPAGAGISGSSALMVATTAALAHLRGRKLDRERMRVIAQSVETQLIRVPTGCQDYYPALYGGVNAIHLGVEGVTREALAVSAAEIEGRFILVYSGEPRRSGINNWEVFQRHIKGEPRLFRNFEQISLIAQSMREALVEGSWGDVAELLRDEWKLRRTNAPGITTPFIDKLVAAARGAGAHAAKVCGAGGGGCVIFLADRENQDAVASALRNAGGRILPFKVGRRGVTVREEAA